jgi:hypothetical protein
MQDGPDRRPPIGPSFGSGPADCVDQAALTGIPMATTVPHLPISPASAGRQIQRTSRRASDRWQPVLARSIRVTAAGEGTAACRRSGIGGFCPCVPGEAGAGKASGYMPDFSAIDQQCTYLKPSLRRASSPLNQSGPICSRNVYQRHRFLPSRQSTIYGLQGLCRPQDAGWNSPGSPVSRFRAARPG